MRALVLFTGMLAIIPLGIARPFVGVLMWDWIAFMNPHQLEWGFGSDLPWASVAFAVTMIGWFASRTEPKRLALNPTSLLMLAFMAGITITSCFALGSADAVWSAWSRTCKILLFLIVTMSLLTEQRRIVALVWLIVICLGYFVATQGTLAVLSGGEHKAFGPPNSMLTDNNEFAAALLVVLPLMNFLRLHARHGSVRIGLALLMCLTLLTILASYSRGAVIGLGVVALLLALRSRRKLLTLLHLAARWVPRSRSCPRAGSIGSTRSKPTRPTNRRCRGSMSGASPGRWRCDIPSPARVSTPPRSRT